MGRPAHIPDVGDVPIKLVALRMGYSSVREFEAALPAFRLRGFPAPDPTSGRYCIEAVDRWRRRRHPDLFPELGQVADALDASVARLRLQGKKAARQSNGQRKPLPA